MIARIFRRPFSVRRSLLVLGTVAVGLAFPAGSMAATKHVPCSPKSQQSCIIKTASVKKGNGFKLTLSFAQGTPTGYGGRYPNSLTATLVKKSDSGHATETDAYTFSASQRHLKFTTGKKPLQFAKITGTSANGDASINMTFHATGQPVHVNVPKGCTSDTGASSGIKRTGTLSGSYTLKADKLGRITQKSFKATISTVGWTCSRPTHGYDVQTTDGRNPYVDVFMGPKGKVTETIAVSGSRHGWAFVHSFIVRDLPTADYTLDKTHLNTATVTGGGGISGSASYNSPQESSNQTSGTMSGSLAAPFASIGTKAAFPKSRSAKQSHS